MFLFSGGRRLVPLAFFVFAAAMPQAHGAPKAAGSTFAIHESLPAARPDFPVPSDRNMVFYIQRSNNSNTVVYTANIGKDGRLSAREPVKAFWRRFNTTGEAKALGFFEKQMAYGVSARKGKAAGEYEVSFTALPGRRATMRQAEDGSVELVFPMGKYQAKPVYAYVEVNDEGMVPKVERVRLYGIDVASGKAVVETIKVSGGEITE